MKEQCAVCCEPCLKQYHCPRCAAPYCGVQCFRSHKEQCTVQPAAEKEFPQTPYDVAVQRADEPPPGPSPTLVDEGDDELDVLRGCHLSALANHPGIRNQIKSAELQKLIRIVNNSRSRLDALDAALHNVSEFKEFCDLVLSVVHSCDQRAPS